MLRESASPRRAFLNTMKYNCLFALSLAILSAPGGFPQVVLNQVPSRSVGHPKTPTLEQLTVYTVNPNLVEGRELYQPRGLALDTSASPPILYVSDTGNNRVLAWKNATAFTNGQRADMVIGQPDMYSTLALGPATKTSTGLSSPTGLAVDAHGNLYVADSGNNRVLRFPAPFNQTAGQALLPDIVIGQQAYTSSTANAPSGLMTARNLKLASGETGLAFDPSGNLFVVDPGNRRVVGFRASDLTSGATGPSAFIEIGQLSFDQAWPTQLNTADGNSPQVTNQFAIPAGIAFDSQGRLYVADGDVSSSSSRLLGRVLVFQNPNQLPPTAAQAFHLYGVFPPSNPPTTQDQVNHVQLFGPQGVFILPDGTVGVVDTSAHRILVFPSVDNWPGDGSAPQAIAVVGHTDYANRFGNNAQSNLFTPPASSNSLLSPMAAAYSTAGLFVADTLNNRVLLLPQLGAGFASATNVLGQDRLDTNSINLIEGREFSFQLASGSSLALDAGIAVDSTGPTPHLYVADTYNHRVLGFKDLRTVAPGVPADVVIGQPNFQTALCNYPSGDVNSPSNANLTSLCGPTGLLVDSAGNLYVSDMLNGRVLRFPTPFAQTGPQRADLVLGKRSLSDTISDPSASTLKAPYGLAFVGQPATGLVVSDAAYNRVLYYPFSAGGTFTAGTDNGKTATVVFGQQRFIDTASGNGLANLNTPQHVASDTSGRVYVADSGNGRVLVFDDPHSTRTTATGSTGIYAIGGLNAPQGVYVSPATGEIWVTNTRNSTVVKYPEFSTLILSGGSTAGVYGATFTLAVTQDQFGDLVVADASNRVSLYFPAPQKVVNAANYLTTHPLAPQTYAAIFAQGNQFGTDTANHPGNDLPTTLADIQVLLDGSPAPLWYVSPSQINFYVPNGAPGGGTADLQVVKASTGQVYAASTVQMRSVSPGIFSIDTAGKVRRAAVINQDGTINDPSNPATRGSIISIYATGFGSISNAPPDGAPAPGPPPDTGLVTVPDPRIVIGGAFPEGYPHDPADPSDGKFIKFSGLTPGIVGLWQINFQIPMGVAPASQVTLAVVMNNVASWDTSDPNNFITTIAVK
jgi:uncharacterized protein (TIGR03437 family)